MKLETSATDPRGRLIAIGDVHGCSHALEALLEAIHPTPDDRLVFLGDLIDQGRDSCAVLELIMDLQQQLEVVVIRGNHEEMLFGARESESLLRYWENCGGVATLNSYRFGGGLDAIPPHHWEFLAASQRYHETENFIFAHANYQHDLPMDEQPDYQLRWGLFKPEEMQAHQSGKTVIVGHTEQANSEILDIGFAICIDTACWRYGWLTALDVRSRQYWQASRWGVLREAEEPAHRGRLPQFERAYA
jgi:serine/threonine protein phosphatase 1